jgi:acetyl esterase/lipase
MGDIEVVAAMELWPAGAPGAMGSSPQDRPMLTGFLPAGGGGPTAAVVVCPGGAYVSRSAHEGQPVARWLAGAGVAAFVLDYRTAPYRHPIPLGDAQRAIRMVRHNAAAWRVDSARVGILGFSAGGHLAASAATFFDGGNETAADPVDRQPCRPDALIVCYPVITFGEFRHDGSMRNLLGPQADEALRQRLSLENSVTPQNPPAFIWHTADDAGVPVENALVLASALRRAGVSFAMHIFRHGRHGLGLADDRPVGIWTRLCEQWLAEIGFMPAGPGQAEAT